VVLEWLREEILSSADHESLTTNHLIPSLSGEMMKCDFLSRVLCARVDVSLRVIWALRAKSGLRGLSVLVNEDGPKSLRENPENNVQLIKKCRTGIGRSVGRREDWQVSKQIVDCDAWSFVGLYASFQSRIRGEKSPLKKMCNFFLRSEENRKRTGRENAIFCFFFYF
jgi:hypothetical protein